MGMHMAHRGPQQAHRLQTKFDAWPRVDQALWQQAIGPVDLLAPNPPAAAWRESTRKTVSKAYGRWLGWLADDPCVHDGTTPVARACPERVGAYLAHLRATTSPRTTASYLQGLGMALHAMQPHEDLSTLWEAVNRLQRCAPPTRRKRERIVPVQELLAFGRALMHDISLDDPLMAAVRYRDGLMICLLAARPIRIRNLQMMEFGRHLVPQGDSYFLRFAAAETKTGQEIDLPLPATFSLLFDAYRQIHRPILLARAKVRGGIGDGDAAGKPVWISRFGNKMAVAGLHGRIVEITRKRFGKSVNPHLFRDCVATSIALDDPDHIDITMSLLGHATRATSERYYNHALSRKAAGLQQRLIADMRRQYRLEEAKAAFSQKGRPRQPTRRLPSMTK
jgi:integrase/recombinase XerD